MNQYFYRSLVTEIVSGAGEAISTRSQSRLPWRIETCVTIERAQEIMHTENGATSDHAKVGIEIDANSIEVTQFLAPSARPSRCNGQVSRLKVIQSFRGRYLFFQVVIQDHVLIQVLYFHDFAPDEIPTSIVKGFEKLEWSKYGCTLAGFARWGPGEAMLEIKGPSNVKLQLVVHCYLANILALLVAFQQPQNS